MQIFFTWPIFWLLLIGQVPLITMRVFSEEFKLGTIEMLLTAPVGEWDVRPRQILRRPHLLSHPLASDCTRSDDASSFSPFPRHRYHLVAGGTDRADHHAGRRILRFAWHFQLGPHEEPDHRSRSLLRVSSQLLRHIALALGPAYRCGNARPHLLRLPCRNICKTPSWAFSIAVRSSFTSLSPPSCFSLPKASLKDAASRVDPGLFSP